jgi:hypothetical protein
MRAWLKFVKLFPSFYGVYRHWRYSRRRSLQEAYRSCREIAFGQR